MTFPSSAVTSRLHARSAWAWPQAAIWLALGAIYLNLPPLVGALMGLLGYLAGGLVAAVRTAIDPAERPRPTLGWAKWMLPGLSFCLCLSAAMRPELLERGAALAGLFRPSAEFPNSTFYGGWLGEPVIMAGLLLIAFCQYLLNELRFPEDRMGGPRLHKTRLDDRGVAFGMFLLGLLMVSAISFVLLESALVGDTGPRGHLFNARLGPVWAFAWWAFLSAMLLFLRVVRLASAGVALERPLPET